MALKIRLRQQGRTNRQTFRLVVTDIRNPRDGKYLETLGSYDPLQAENNFKVDAERLTYWLGKGAQLSENAQQLLAKVIPDVIQGMTRKQQEKRIKMAAKRRALKQKKTGAVKKAAPKAKAVAKEAAPAKKPRAKKPKKDES